MCSGQTRMIVYGSSFAMLTLEELVHQVSAHGRGETSFDEFENWFRANARGAYANPDGRVSDLCADVEDSFSRRYFHDLDAESFRKELAQYTLPFVPSASHRDIHTVTARIANGTFWESVAERLPLPATWGGGLKEVEFAPDRAISELPQGVLNIRLSRPRESFRVFANEDSSFFTASASQFLEMELEEVG